MINSSLTIQLIPLISYLLTSNILMALNLLHELVNPSELFYFQIIINGSWFLLHTFIMILLVYSGNSTTATAQETPVIISKICSNVKGDDMKKENDLRKFLSLLQHRNLHLQSFIFKVNWKLPVAVS